MSTNMQNVTNKTVPPRVPAKGSGRGLGVNLSSGTEAAVTVALSDLQQMLCEISNKELEQYTQMADATKQASLYSAQQTRDNGKQMFQESLAQGLGSIAGGALSLGMLRLGKANDPSKVELKKIGQEEQGVKNYRNALPKASNVNVNEIETPAIREKNEARKKDQDDRKTDIEAKLKSIKEKTAFTDNKGKALELDDQDETLIGLMTDQQATELRDALDSHLKTLAKNRKAISRTQSTYLQDISTVSQSVGQIASGGGNVAAAFAKQAQGKSQADSALSNSAAQGMQSIMAQLLKTANDALQHAEQTIQTFATISNGNKFQG